MAPTVSDAPIPGTSAADALDGPGIAAIVDGHLLRASPRPVRRAAVDSRRVEPGMVFVALPGEHTDGHRFLADAVARGAAALLVTSDLPDRDLDALSVGSPGDRDAVAGLHDPGAAGAAVLDDGQRGCSIVRVDDGLRALQRLASAWRGRFDPLVVGITGSVAKTSTKEATATVLAQARRVLRSEGNENNEIGLPLTLLRLERGHEVAVLEMGMYVPGEIAQLAAMARPSIGIVTAVRGVHLERAGSIDAIEQGKGQLVEALPETGTAILNADDFRVRRMDARTRARVLTYGFDAGADVSATDVTSVGLDGMRFSLRLPGSSAPLRVTSPVLGRHAVHNGLAAAAAGVAAGLAASDIVAGLGRGWAAPHRDEVRRIGEWTAIDDTYNAGPDSMAAALDLLATLPGRRIAVLGEMLELGPESEALHRSVGTGAARSVDLLIPLGEGARPIVDGALAAGIAPERVRALPDFDAALEVLPTLLRSGDVVLFKASRGLGMDPRERARRGLGLDDLLDALAASSAGATA